MRQKRARKEPQKDVEQLAAEARQKRCDETTIEINKLLAERKTAMQVFVIIGEHAVPINAILTLPVEIRTVPQ